MKNKMMLLALGLLALVFAAMPAAASAGSWELDSKALPVTFNTSGTHAELRASGEPSITCTSSTGTGKYTTKTTGEFELTFKGCITSFFGFPVECHSTGQLNNVITTGTSVFHNTYLTDAKTTPGILVTPPTGGVFSVITCAGLSSITVAGNGIIGDLASPKCGATSNTGTLNFSATGSVQNVKSPTATSVNGVYNLTATTSGGTAVEAGEQAEGTATYAESVTVTCV